MLPGASPWRPVDTRSSRSSRRAARVAEGRPVLEVHALAQALAEPGREPAPRAVGDRLVEGLEALQPGEERGGQRRPQQQVVEGAPRPLLDAVPLLVVDHLAGAGGEHAARPRVHHDQPHVAHVAPVAPAGAGDLAVGAEGEVAQDRAAVARGGQHVAVHGVLLALGAVEVAQVLEGPVGHEAADDALVPPGLGAHRAHPFVRRVPVVVDVVVVEDHRRGHRRQQPAHARLAPGVLVQAAVLLEVGDLHPRRHRRRRGAARSSAWSRAAGRRRRPGRPAA